MKTVLYFAGAAIFLASCSNSQQSVDKASQARVDSMSQELMRQHIVDSMNSANAMPAAAPATTSAPARHSNGSYSQERTHTYTGNTPASGGTAASQPAAVTPTGPTAADIAAKKKADRNREITSSVEGGAIGAGAGAIGGAIAGKNDKFKKQDAAIGGGVGAVLGAGAGYLIERHKLKKDSTRH